MTRAALSNQDYESFRTFLESACGIVLGENKHYLVVSRLSRLMADEGVETLADLVAHLKDDRKRQLRERIVEAMTTNETFWFRDTFPFDILKETIFPDLADRRVRSPRIWSSACSSGQEPYSISMTIQEYQASRPGSLTDVQIMATDISPTILLDAKEASYDALALARGLSNERKQKFFTPLRDGRWQARPEIRNRVRFSQANLLQSYSLLGRFDVIFCRNVLIYFSSESKSDILARMARVLNPGGYLFLGSSESITQYSDEFEMVRCPRGSVYRVKSGLVLKPTAPIPRPIVRPAGNGKR
ncbi:MAG: protein-glutamate O-methyltransferase CheR [Gammaproteobacteria bacterium]|nr:protein-glutamate O-methyltransferase CheR [Gammaproteobacteria bacterium]MBU2478022.1 protein-glutamate O-methyltransferase CheR [Gammaproteobacteria bacterium]